MDHLVIAQTEQTPLVSFLSNGIMEISGKSIDQDSVAFWQPVLSWVKAYSIQPAKKTCLNLFIDSLDNFEQSFKVNEADFPQIDQLESLIEGAFLTKCIHRFIEMRNDWTNIIQSN